MAWEAGPSETFGCEPCQHVALEAAAREDDVPLVLDADGETLRVWRVWVEEGLPEVLCEVLGGVRRAEGGCGGAHVCTAVYVSDLDEITCATVTDVGVDGK